MPPVLLNGKISKSEEEADTQEDETIDQTTTTRYSLLMIWQAGSDEHIAHTV
ncbi:hypothetical protein PENANT_c002G07974 [Penicillium antarcticum]|uniref:Uncharacterized protein n=1 Tax=Penicillium antarcticum TaxID=416450 RepID=A0A1V6QKG3_9EURO|nr:hypothetical protein PENANT_c002G07974 [Penicillium antarcticum]